MLSEQEGTKAALIARDIVRASKGGTYTAKQGMYLNIGDFEITVIGYFEDMIDENDRTVIMMAEIDGVRFLLMGDAEKAAESMLLDEDLDLSCDVLKVAHHGSRSSTTSRFLRRTDPKYAVISSGKGNQFSHPHKETLETLKNSRAKVYRTDVSGDVTFYVKDGKITVTTEK